jgi:hypothetical protein
MKPNYTAKKSLTALVALLLVGASGCQHDEPVAAYPTYTAPPPGQPGQPAPTAYPGQPAPPGQPAAYPQQAPAQYPPQPAAQPAAAAALPSGPDPINGTDLTFLRAEAASVMHELITNLPPLQQGARPAT